MKTLHALLSTYPQLWYRWANLRPAHQMAIQRIAEYMTCIDFDLVNELLVMDDSDIMQLEWELIQQLERVA